MSDARRHAGNTLIRTSRSEDIFSGPWFELDELSINMPRRFKWEAHSSSSLICSI
jgi:hypothetical protein